MAPHLISRSSTAVNVCRMLFVAGQVKRQYRSTARKAATAATRERIRQAAASLFVAKRYVATTMREIAAEAGVGERTLYDSFPTKAALFSHTLGVATVGDEEPVRVAGRTETLAALSETDPREGIRKSLDYATSLLERASDLIMVSIEAAGADPDMKATAEAGARGSYQIHLALTEALHERHSLRSGLEAATAADILYCLCSPHLHQLLRRHRRWSREQYRLWLEGVVTAELLG